MVTDFSHQNVNQGETRSKREETIQIAKALPRTDFSARGLPPHSLPIAEGLLRVF